MVAIEITNLTKHFGDVVALDGVDLEVRDGEIFGFLGPNGAGKSTTIDIMLDFVRPTSGSVRVLGMDAQADSLEIRRRTGVLPDAYHVYERLSGRQHVQLAIDSKGSDDDAMALLDRVGIADAADRKAGGYSKGMAQRLVLAMALAGEPDILILDEPSTGLDPNGAREMRRLIREEAARGATVFFSSHILEQVEAICDRVAILKQGRIVTVDTIDGLRAAAGSGTELTITVDTVYDGSLAAIGALEGVRSVDATDSVVTVMLDSGSKTAILDVLESAGSEILDFSTAESSLEDLFVSFTGDGDSADEESVETDATAGVEPSVDADTDATEEVAR